MSDIKLPLVTPRDHPESRIMQWSALELAEINRLMREAVRLNAQTVPDGWKLVPIEPTDEMEMAWDDAHGDGAPFHSMYAAMLSAAPAAPQPAQQPLTFAGVAKRKLDELQTQGYSVVGYMLARAEADGTVTRGAIDTGGMVIWWNQQKASQPNG